MKQQLELHEEMMSYQPNFSTAKVLAHPYQVWLEKI